MPLKKLLVFACIPLLIFYSCKTESEVVLPLEEEKIIAILADMHFAKSAALVHPMELRDSMRLVYESQVFTIHEITKEDFNNIQLILESDLKLYYEIEKKVYTKLKEIQNEKT